MKNIFVFVLLLCAFAFAGPASGAGAGAVSILAPVKGMLLGLLSSLLPLVVVSAVVLVLVKLILPGRLEKYADSRMAKKGYERVQPERVKYMGNYYRRVSGGGSGGTRVSKAELREKYPDFYRDYER